MGEVAAAARRAGRHGLALVVSAVVLAAGAAGGCRAHTIRVAKAVPHPAVVTLDAVHEGSRRLVGSGFFVSGDEVVTAHHVMRAAALGRGLAGKPVDVEAVMLDGTRLRVLAVLGDSPDEDAIVLVVEEPRSPPDPLALRDEPAAFGEPVALVGRQADGTPVVTLGRVASSGYSGHPTRGDAFDATTPSVGGTSGGPVLDREGRVLGIAVRGGEGADPGTEATSSRVIAPLLDVERVQFETWRKRMGRSSRERAAQLLDQAGIDESARSQESALTYYRAALDAADDEQTEEQALAGICSCLVSLRRAHEARTLAKSWVLDRSQSEWVHRQLAEVLVLPDERPLAHGHLKKARALSPHDARCALELGSWCARNAEDADAIVALRDAVALAPRWAYAWEMLAFVAARADRRDEAADAYRRLATLRPDYVRGLEEYAAAAWRAGRAEEGFSAALAAIERQPGSVAAHLILAGLHRDAGDDAAVLRAMATVRRLDPSQGSESPSSEGEAHPR
jgi:tetratricopeptide (TPR) repeat protein